MKPLMLISGPVTTRSGYGSHTRDLVRSHSDLKLMINDGSKLGEIVQENTYSIVENY